MCSTPGMTSGKTNDQVSGDDADSESPDPLDQLPCPSLTTFSLYLHRPPTPAPRPLTLVPTHPSSPTVNTALCCDPFERSSLITQGGLVRCLEAETDQIHHMGPSERIMCEEPGYAEYEHI